MAQQGDSQQGGLWFGEPRGGNNGPMNETDIRALFNELAGGGGATGSMAYPSSKIKNAWQPGADEATSIYNQGLPPLDPNNYLANTMAQLNAPNPFVDQIGEFNPANPGIPGYDQFMPGNTNPYADRMFNISADRIQDQINSQFGMSGQGSSSGNLQEQISQLGDYGAKFYGGIYDADMNRGLDATHGKVAAYGDQSRLGLDALGMGTTGYQNRTNAAATFLPDIQRQIQDNPYNSLEKYAAIVGQLTGSSPQSPSREKTSGWDKIIGLGSLGIGAKAAGLFSDPRMKTDIELVGRHAPTGLNIYHFNYQGDPRRFEGVMSDEVRQVRPDAVIVGDDGFDRVFYDRLGLEMREIH